MWSDTLQKHSTCNAHWDCLSRNKLCLCCLKFSWNTCLNENTEEALNQELREKKTIRGRLCLRLENQSALICITSMHAFTIQTRIHPIIVVSHHFCLRLFPIFLAFFTSTSFFFLVFVLSTYATCHSLTIIALLCLHVAGCLLET